VMGTKERIFSPLPYDVSLEDLVPKDNCFRHLEQTLDLSTSGTWCTPRQKSPGVCVQ
jgi:hypothetical protein